jgi:hypothetical protein
MPRFYFDFSYGAGLENDRDEEGRELEGLAQARMEATNAAAEILRDYPDRFWNDGAWNCTVRDEAGRPLFVLHFYADDAPCRADEDARPSRAPAA